MSLVARALCDIFIPQMSHNRSRGNVTYMASKDEITDRTTVFRGSFARWPSNYLGLEKIGNEVFIAWTDPVKKKVRLAVIAMTAKD
jgi:hypothetical protein